MSGVREQYAFAGGSLYFSASDGATGHELWRLDPQHAVAQRTGDSCGGLRLEGTDPVIGLANGFKWSVVNLRKRHVGVLILGAPARRSLVLGGCELQVDIGQAFLAQPFVTAGSTSFGATMTIPNNPQLRGQTVTMQVLELPTTTSFPTGLRASNGVELFLETR